jgi:hypothetical protein
MAAFFVAGLHWNERLRARSLGAAVAAIFLLVSFPLTPPAKAADDQLQQLVNYIFTGSIAPPDPPQIVDRDTCVVLVHEVQFNRFARYYLKRFNMDTAQVAKRYAGSRVLYELDVNGDDIILEFLKADNTTVDYGFRSAHIPLPGDIAQTEKALRLIYAEHCKTEKAKPPF